MPIPANPVLMRGKTLRLARIACVLAVGFGMPRAVEGADPVPYDVTIAPSGNAALDQALNDASTLKSLHDAAPVGAFALVARARSDAARFTQALHSFGFLQGHRPTDDRRKTARSARP